MPACAPADGGTAPSVPRGRLEGTAPSVPPPVEATERFPPEQVPPVVCLRERTHYSSAGSGSLTYASLCSCGRGTAPSVPRGRLEGTAPSVPHPVEATERFPPEQVPPVVCLRERTHY